MFTVTLSEPNFAWHMAHVWAHVCAVAWHMFALWHGTCLCCGFSLCHSSHQLCFLLAGFCQYIVGGNAVYRISVSPPRKAQPADQYTSPIFDTTQDKPSSSTAHQEASAPPSLVKAAPGKPNKPLPPLPAKPNRPPPPLPAQCEDAAVEDKRDLLMD
jgi:hypothetical protein